MIVKVLTDGTLDIVCLAFNSLAAIPSIEDLILLKVTYCPGIPPCARSSNLYNFDPAEKVLTGLALKDRTLLILRLFKLA